MNTHDRYLLGLRVGGTSKPAASHIVAQGPTQNADPTLTNTVAETKPHFMDSLRSVQLASRDASAWDWSQGFPPVAGGEALSTGISQAQGTQIIYPGLAFLACC